MEVLTNFAGDVLQIMAVPLALTFAALITAVSFKAAEKFGLDIEQRHRDAFQTAIHNAALEVVRRAGGPGIAQRIDDVHLVPAVQQAIRGAGDAIKKFKVNEDEVEKRILAQAVDMIQRAPTTNAPLSTPGTEAANYKKIDEKLSRLARR